MFKQAIRVGAVVAAIGFASAAFASPLLLNRGLPTANLNNAAGTNRSNVAWVAGGYTGSDYWMVGDTFTNNGAQAWTIDTIRIWTVGSTTTASLWGGVNGGSIGLVSSSGAISAPVTYADGSTYQGSSSFYDMFAVDFAVNITLLAGQTYDFFLDGSGGNYTIPFAHASNGALSGSPQDGADNSMLWGEVVSGSFNQSSVQSWSSLGNGWDKASDVNVQVFGNSVPEPASLALVAVALLGVVGVSRRRA